MMSALRDLRLLGRYAVLLFLDLVCLCVPRRGKACAGEKVLVVRLDAVGDFVLWTASLQPLVAPYLLEGDPVALLGNASWSSAAASLGQFCEVLSLDRGRFLSSIPYRLCLLVRIRQARYGTVIVPVYSRELLFGDSVIRISGARNRIGSTGDCTNMRPWLKRVADSWYTRLLPADPALDTELQRNEEFVSRLWGIELPPALPALPVLAPLPEELRGREYFVVAPGAQVAGKQWPLANFRELMERIQQESGMTGVICGAPGEEGLGVALSSGGREEIIDYVGRTTLVELIALIAGAKLVLSNDTAAVHIAFAVSTPSVCVLGGYHFGRFLPYRRTSGRERPLPITLFHVMPCFQCNWRCPYQSSAEAPFPCVSSVTPDEVWQAVEPILCQGGKAPRG